MPDEFQSGFTPYTLEIEMKTNLITLIITAVTIASCGKDHPADVQPEQSVTYTVECKSCLVYAEDNTWNRDNEQERSQSQPFNISGVWRYQWTNTNRDSVSMRIVVGTFLPRHKVTATIRTSDGRSAGFQGELGFDPARDDSQEHKSETTLKLGLR